LPQRLRTRGNESSSRWEGKSHCFSLATHNTHTVCVRVCALACMCCQRIRTTSRERASAPDNEKRNDRKKKKKKRRSSPLHTPTEAIMDDDDDVRRGKLANAGEASPRIHAHFSPFSAPADRRRRPVRRWRRARLLPPTLALSPPPPRRATGRPTSSSRSTSDARTGPGERACSSRPPRSPCGSSLSPSLQSLYVCNRAY